MTKCSLCKTKNATQKNSHIIPWALIKDSLNQPGFKERDYDVTYAISTLDIPKSYFGRNVSPDHIEKLKGRVLTEDEIKKNKNPLSFDDIFCPNCEELISKLENEFVKEVYSKLHNPLNRNKNLHNKGNKTLTITNYKSKVTYLLAYSIFFRTSIINLNNHSLSLNIKEKIRALLLNSLSIDYSVLIKNINQLDDSNFPFPIILFYLENENITDVGNNIITQNKSNKPYFIWANKVIFQLFEKEKHINSSIEYFFGLSQMLKLNDYRQQISEGMKICFISNKSRIVLVQNVIEYLAIQNMKNGKLFLNEACKKLFNRRATLQEKNIFGYHYSIIITDH